MAEHTLPDLLRDLPGPWVIEDSGLPPGGPRRWWRGPAGAALTGPPARVAAELEGWRRLGPHPARPEILASSEHCLLFPHLGEPPEDPVAVVAGWPRGERWQGRGRLGALLEALPGKVDPGRSLAGLGVKRKHVDRLLAREVEVATRIGQGFGGIDGGWLRALGGGVVALRFGLAQRESWAALDLAATGLAAGEDLRALHAEGLPAGPADLAYDLCLLVRALDEAVLGDDAAAGAAALEVVARLLPEAPPERVLVALEGAPDWLDPRLWLPSDGEVDAARARRLLHLLDGLAVGGAVLKVRTEPELRAGRAPPPRSPQRERRLRLFSRWEQGIRVDEEGLWSATPEALADQLVVGLRGHVVDGTCGVGSLTLALARLPAVTRVTAIDLDPGRLELARHNARIYGVSERIRFICGDVRAALPGDADALVLDPPWGGRDYDRQRVGLQDLGLDLAAALACAPATVRLKLPRSFDVGELARLPGSWRVRPLLDGEVIKMLVGERG